MRNYDGLMNDPDNQATVAALFAKPENWDEWEYQETIDCHATWTHDGWNYSLRVQGHAREKDLRRAIADGHISRAMAKTKEGGQRIVLVVAQGKSLVHIMRIRCST